MGCAKFVFPRWEQSTGSGRGLWQRRRRERGCCVIIRPWPISCLGRTHARAVAVYIPEGAFTFDHEGKATMTYKAEDTLYIEANKIHEGINKERRP